MEHFIIGASPLTVLPFYLSVILTNKDKRNYSFEQYAIIAPIYLGLITYLSAIIGKNINLKLRLFITSIISVIIVSLFATIIGSYNYNKKEMIQYYFRILLFHLITFNVTIYFIYKNIQFNLI